MTQKDDWRSYEATAMWWSFAITLLLLTDLAACRLAGLACLCVALARRWSQARHKPGLLAFVLFSLTVMALFEYGGKDFSAATVAFTGWVAHGPYFSSIMFGVLALLSNRKVTRYCVVGMLGVSVVLGLVEWFAEWPRASPNPYLAISVWRPVWTVAVPLSWIAVLLIEELRSNRGPGSRSGPRPHNNELQRTSDGNAAGSPLNSVFDRRTT